MLHKHRLFSKKKNIATIALASSTVPARGACLRRRTLCG